MNFKPETHELSLTRLLDAPREKLFRCWTDAELLKQWFVPNPWTIARAELDVRPGGSTLIVMKNPEGDEFPNPGIYLEIVENEKIVLTDAYTSAWVPSAKPFMTSLLPMKAIKPVTPQSPVIGRKRTERRTKKWAFMKAGAFVPISLKNSPKAFEARLPDHLT